MTTILQPDIALGRQVTHQIGIRLPHCRGRGLLISQIHPQQLLAPRSRRAKILQLASMLVKSLA